MKRLKDWIAYLRANMQYFVDIYSDALFKLELFFMVVVGIVKGLGWAYIILTLSGMN